jgi:hypothetical protein
MEPSGSMGVPAKPQAVKLSSHTPSVRPAPLTAAATLFWKPASLAIDFCLKAA